MTLTDDLLKEISEKLDRVLKLLTINVIGELNQEQEKIELLDSAGFRPVEIAKLLNKTPENVNVQLGTLRKRKEVKTTMDAKTKENKICAKS
jgi:cell division protein ZapA (FtsZ GTPase activity inhibitor)